MTIMMTLIIHKKEMQYFWSAKTSKINTLFFSVQ